MSGKERPVGAVTAEAEETHERQLGHFQEHIWLNTCGKLVCTNSGQSKQRLPRTRNYHGRRCGFESVVPAIHFTSGDQFSRAQMVANLERPVPVGQVYRDICGPKGRALPLGDSAWHGLVPTFPGFVR
jgi:hypothetical protein